MGLAKTLKTIGGAIAPFNPLISAGAQVLGGSIVSKGQRKANEVNIQLARENREFQERMSNTA